jgi:arylsulfatase
VARTIHKTPWGSAALNTLDKDVWQLYNVNEDFSETNDLASANPAKLKELQDLFLKEAIKYNVLPIDDRNYERFDAAIAGRPDLMGKRTKLNLYDGMNVCGIVERLYKRRYHFTSRPLWWLDLVYEGWKIAP